MGKNKLSSGLINVVTYDTENNISLNSGSNLLMSLSGSGKVTIPGNLVVLGGISGSSAESSSYALNADKIDNLDSTQLVLTSSFNSYTSSASSSLGSLSSSVATTTSNLSSSIGSLSGSVATTTSGLAGRIGTIEGRYATTGSNTFIGDQTITGSICSNGNIVTTGQIVAQTINVQQVTSSIVYSCGSNIFGNDISNTQQFTGSMLATGSLTLAGPMIGISTACFGGNVCASSGTFSPTYSAGGTATVMTWQRTGGAVSANMIYNDANTSMNFGTNTAHSLNIKTNDTNRLTIDSGGVSCFACQVCAPNHIASSTCSTAALRIYGASGTHQWDIYLNGNNLRFSDNTSGAGCFIVDNTTTFGSSVGLGTSPLTKLHLYDSSPNYILLTNTGADGVSNAIQGGIIGQSRGYSNNLAQMANILFRNKNTAAWYKGEISFSTNDSDGTNPAVSPVERMRISSDGNVGIGTAAPDSVLEIRGSTSSPQFRISRLELTNQGLTIQAGGGVASFNSYDGTDTVFGGYVFNGTKCNTTVERMRITTDGVACFSCQVRVQGDIVISSTSSKFYQLTNNCKSADSVLDIYNTATNGFGVSIQAGANNNNYALTVSNFQSTPLLYVAGNGQVGIGCGTPNAKLTINSGNSFSSIRIYGCNSSYTSQLGFYDSTNLNQGSDGVGGDRVALIEIGTVAGTGTGCRGANMALYTHEANGSLKQPLLLMHNGNVCLPQGNLYTTCTLFAPGTPIQVITGTAIASSGASGNNASLGPSAGGSTPGYNCGCLITSVSFTPKSASSKILIQTNSVALWETANVADHFYLWASNDSAGNVLTKSGGYVANLGQCTGTGTQGAIINLNGAANSWGTSTNTISFRIGTSGGPGNYYQWNPYYGAGGFNADTVGHFTYTIMEIAQ